MTSSILSHGPYQQPPAMHGYGAPPQHPPPRAYIGSSAPRYGMTHGQNSAHSPSANPDEDWTKISDLAERRRIQNRIAQRNYRKKLKRRLEDLERRASSTSPPPGGNGALPSQHDMSGPKRRPSKPGTLPPKRSPNPNTGAFTSPNPNEYANHPNGQYPRRDSRQPSITPPPSLIYSSGSTTTSPSMPSLYQPQQTGHQGGQPPYFSTPYTDSAYPSMPQPILPPPAGLGLSRLPNNQDWNQSKPYGEEEMFNQFGMNGQYPASTGAPYEAGVAGVSTGYPEQGIYSNPSMY